MNYSSLVLLILKISFLFMCGSIAGWLIEIFWRRYRGKARRWINPGFLSGPWLPLYGFGTVILYYICDLKLELYFLVPVFFFSMTLLEYAAGKIFIGHFKIQLWDYSGNRGNIQGLICPLYSVFWTVLGIIFYYLFYPVLLDNLHMLLNNLELSFFVGIYTGIFSMDLWSSFNLAGRIKKYVSDTEEKWQVDYEKFKLELRDRIIVGIKNRTHFLLPFHGEHGSSLRERLKEHRQNLPKPVIPFKRKKD